MNLQIKLILEACTIRFSHDAILRELRAMNENDGLLFVEVFATVGDS